MFAFKQQSSFARLRLHVRFEGEPASGVGVFREWFHVVAAQLFDFSAGFFRATSGGTAVEINPSSNKFVHLGDHLRVFRFWYDTRNRRVVCV